MVFGSEWTDRREHVQNPQLFPSVFSLGSLDPAEILVMSRLLLGSRQLGAQAPISGYKFKT